MNLIHDYQYRRQSKAERTWIIHHHELSWFNSIFSARLLNSLVPFNDRNNDIDTDSCVLPHLIGDGFVLFTSAVVIIYAHKCMSMQVVGMNFRNFYAIVTEKQKKIRKTMKNICFNVRKIYIPHLDVTPTNGIKRILNVRWKCNKLTIEQFSLPENLKLIMLIDVELDTTWPSLTNTFDLPQTLCHCHCFTQKLCSL